MAKERNSVRAYREKLNLLLDMSQSVNADSSIDDLMHGFEYILKEELNVGRILVFTHFEGSWHCILQSNVDDVTRDSIDIETHLKDMTDITLLAMTDIKELTQFDAVLPLQHNHKLMGYMLIGDTEDGDGLSPTLRNLKFIQIVSNVVIIFIENKKMQMSLLQQEVLRRELSVASRIQSGLIPTQDALSKSNFLNVQSYYHPHHKVGGDYFDIIPLSRYSVGFCIADVSGKGIAAALLMSNFQAMVRSLMSSGRSLRSMTIELNKRVCENVHGEKFITMFLGRYNKITGLLSYVNAGHLPPLLHQEQGVRELVSGCIGLGMLEEMPGIDVGCVNLHKGDLLVAYTDGLVELEDKDNVITCTDKLVNIMKNASGIDMTMKEIKKMADESRLFGQTIDDTSVLAIELTRKPLLSIR